MGGGDWPGSPYLFIFVGKRAVRLGFEFQLRLIILHIFYIWFAWSIDIKLLRVKRQTTMVWMVMDFILSFSIPLNRSGKLHNRFLNGNTRCILALQRCKTSFHYILFFHFVKSGKEERPIFRCWMFIHCEMEFWIKDFTESIWGWWRLYSESKSICWVLRASFGNRMVFSP